MTKKYWVTTKWPPYQYDEDDDTFTIDLQDGREGEAKEKLKPGDLIFIYQLKTGLVEKGSSVKREIGYGGIIALVKATSTVLGGGKTNFTYYKDGSKMNWKWDVKTDTVLKKKSIKRKTFNRIMDYDPNYTLRGFGKKGSGLKNITKSKFCKILKNFDSNIHEKYCKK